MPDIDLNKTVFISYRRNIHKHLSLFLFKDLQARGFDTFRDSDTIGAGEFEKIILNQIAARVHFVVLLSHGTLDRCHEPGDWLRREIEHALLTKRNIIPVLVDGFKFSDGEKYLKGELSRLKSFQAQPLYTEEEELYNVGLEKLTNQKLKVPIYISVQPTPADDEAKVIQIIEEAVEAPTPTQEELNAEQIFGHVLQKLKNHDTDGAIRALSDIIQIYPEFGKALQNPTLFSTENDKQLNTLLNNLDELHNAASEGRMAEITPMTQNELIRWLRELVYTAQETIAEIDHSNKK